MAQTHSLDLERSSSQYVSIADGSQTGLDLSGDFTFESWIKLESLPSNGEEYFIIDKWNTTGNQRSYRLYYWNDGGTYKFNLGTSSNGSTSSSSDITQPLAVGRWYHVAVTKTGTSATLYIDGLSVGTFSSMASSIFNSSSDFSIGRSASSSNFFDGLIKDVRIFNDVRTAGEIASDAWTENVSDANLQGEWNFNNSYTDTSGNGNTLTPTNSPTFSTNIPWEKAEQVDGSTYLETNLRAYYTLDGDSLDSTANDYDGSDANMTYSAGKIDDGGVFNGTNGRINLPTLTLSNWQQGSISFWIKTSATSTQRLFTLGATNQEVLVQVNRSGFSNKVTIGIWNGTVTTAVGSSADVNTNNWVHIVVTRNGASGKVYVNGIESGSSASLHTTNIGDTSNAIGYNRIGGGEFFNGMIDEVGIYTRELHYGDVLDLYNAGSGITYTAPSPATNSNFFAFI